MKVNQGQQAFSEVANQYALQSGYNVSQLARLSGIPRTTLTSWLSGSVEKPRVWQDVLKLAKVLHLNESEANDLLHMAGWPSLARLLMQAQNETERGMLAFWQQESPSSDRPPPLQAFPDLPNFVGRETALYTLEEWLLAGPPTAPTILIGTAGVGKTALATRLAYRLQAQFPDGILWARLGTTNAMTILRLFAEAYGRDVTSYEDLDSRSAVIREVLAYKQALMVLDNVQSSQEIKYFLPPSGPCVVLLTTRRRDLTLAHNGRRFHLEPFTKEESLALFAQSLGEERVANEQAVLTKIANTVGHLPLAIDIVGCRLAFEPNWDIADFLLQLRRESSLLDNLVHDERCVRSAFITSYNLLASNQQRFFATLGAFSSVDFSVEATAAVANIPVAEAKANLRTLFCLSLVHRGRLGRYRLIPLLRTFAREKIKAEAV